MLVGTTTKLRKALHFLHLAGPAHSVLLNLAKTTAWWPTADPSTTLLQLLETSCLRDLRGQPGFTLLGAPVGSGAYCRDLFTELMNATETVTRRLLDPCDPRMGFHV